MPSILGNGTSALLAFQRALATSSHNVANATVEGYTRQRVELSNRPGDGLRTPPAALHEVWPEATVAAALGRVALPLVQTLLVFGQTGFAPLQSRYAARDVLAGRQVTTSDGQHGQALGVGPAGALRLQLPDRVLEVVSAEVSVRPV